MYYPPPPPYLTRGKRVWPPLYTLLVLGREKKSVPPPFLCTVIYTIGGYGISSAQIFSSHYIDEVMPTLLTTAHAVPSQIIIRDSVLQS